MFVCGSDVLRLALSYSDASIYRNYVEKIVS